MVRHVLVCSVLVAVAIVAMVRAQDGASGLGAPQPFTVDEGVAPAARTAARPPRGRVNRYAPRGYQPANARPAAPPREFAPPANATAADTRAPATPDQVLPNLPSVLKRRGTLKAAPAALPTDPVTTPVSSSIGDTQEDVGEPAELEPYGAASEYTENPAVDPTAETTEPPAELEPYAAPEAALESAPQGAADEDGYGYESGAEPMESESTSPQPTTDEPAFVPPAGGLGGGQESLPARGRTSVQVSSRAPSVRVDVVGPGALLVGKPAVYRISAVNEGADVARNLEIQVALPARVQITSNKATAGDVVRADNGVVTWTVPQLSGGGDEELSLVMMPVDPQPFEVTVDWTARPLPATARVEVQQPQLLVDISGPAEILFGARQIYTISISNPGTGPAEGVLLDVTTGGGSQSKRMGSIPAGGREQVRMELIAREAGQLEIQAVAAGDGGLRSEANQKILVRRAELAVKLIAPSLKFAGATGTYEVHVTNIGNAPATDVEVSLHKPASLKYVGGVEGAQETGGRIAWKVPHLETNEELTYTLELAYGEAGTILCEAVASAGELAAADSAETQVEAIADLKLVVNDPENPKLVGDDVLYEIRVTNKGTKPSGPVNVLGQFSEGIEPQRTEGLEADVVPGQVIFRQIPQVAPGETVALKIIARADKSGNHRFRAVLKATDPETELIAEDMTRFFGSELQKGTTASRAQRKAPAKR